LAEVLRFEGSVGKPELVVLGSMMALTPLPAGVAWGRLSDRLGRRLACLVSGMCRGLGLGLMGVAPSLGWLVAGVALWAVGAGSLAISTDSVADVVPLEQRLAGLGLLVAAVSLGLAAGANLGSLFPAEEPRLALLLCSSLSLSGVVYALAFLPESLAPDRRRRRTVLSPRAPGRARG
jgi:DHA1 family tetracycline resistance protein-like MFS transporter